MYVHHIFFLETTKFGILELNLENQVVGFLEKPGPSTTQSRWAVRIRFLTSDFFCQHYQNMKFCKYQITQARKFYENCVISPRKRGRHSAIPT